MGNIKTHRKRWNLIYAIIILLVSFFPMQVSAYSSDSSQIIFLLDGSKSMSGNRWQEAIDSMAMVSAMLPSDYETAALVYNDEIGIQTDFGQDLESRIEELQKAAQKGYTNTGLALETALGMFSENAAGERRIVIISDGEISMKGQKETEEALALYDAAVQKAVDKNIKIDILLYEDEGIEEQISGGAGLTGGFVFSVADNNFAGKYAEEYLFGQLGLERIMLGSSDSSGNMAEISLRDAYAEHAKILITAEADIEDVQASCQCRNVNVTRGAKFAVIDIEKPMEENFTLQYTLSEKGKINVYLVEEYNLSVRMEAFYSEENARHFIQVHITNQEGQSILTGEDAGEKAEIYINSNKTKYTVEQGIALIPYQVEKSQEIVIKVDFRNLNSIVSCSGEEGSLYLKLPPPPPEEPEPEEDNPYIWLYVVVAGVCAVFAILLFLLLRAKKKTAKPQIMPKGKKALMRC